MAENKVNIKIFKSVFRIFSWILGISLMLFCVIYLLLQVPRVQNYVGKKVTSYISKKTDTDVSLHSVSVSITKGLKLNGLDIADENGSISKIGSLNVSLLNSLYSLRYKKLDIRKITLDDAIIQWLVLEGDKESNFEKFLNKLSGPPKDQKTSDPFEFDLKDVTFNNVRIDIKNNNYNSIKEVTLEKLNVKFDVFEPQSKKYVIEEVVLYKPSFTNSVIKDKIEVTENQKEKNKISEENSKKLYLKLKKLVINDGVVSNHDLRMLNKVQPHFDAKNFDLNDINLSVNNILVDESITGSIEKLSLEIDEKWRLVNFKIKEFILNESELVLNDYQILSPRSSIQNNLTLLLNQDSNLKIIDRITLEGEITNSYIHLGDLAYFAPSLLNSPVVKNLSTSPIFLDGKLSGNINSLLVENVTLSIKDKLKYNGNIRLENIANTNSKIEFDVKNFNSTVSTIDQIIPSFKPSKSILNLNKLNYTGKASFDKTNLGIKGLLKTDLGQVDIDMSIAHSGSQKYKGSIKSKDFDLGKITGVDELGKASIFIRDLDANGTDINTSRIVINGDIQKIEYGKNTYKDIFLDGVLDKGNFEGRLKSNDPNLNFDFDGLINKVNQEYSMKFYSTIDNIDLYKLGITKVPVSIKGNINLDGSGQDINSFIGVIQGENISIQKRDSNYQFNAINLNSFVTSSGLKNVTFDTEGIDINIDGNIDYKYVIDDTKLLIASNFPYYTKEWKIKKDYSPVHQNFRFDVTINSLSPFDEIFNLNDLDFTSLRAKGSVNTLKNEVNIVGSFPELAYKGQKFYNGSTYINLLNQSGEVNFHSDSSVIEGYAINSYDLDSKILGDKINITFSSRNLKDSIGRVEIRSELAPHPKGYVLKILNSDMRIYNKRWKFSSENSIAFGKEFIEIKNFNFSDGTRTLEFADINNRGVIFKANRFQFEAINTILKEKNFYFDGEVISSVRMNDIFEASPDIYGTVLINNLTINNDPYGDLNLDISKPLNENLRAILSIDHTATKQSIKSIIEYDTKSKFVNASIKGRKVPLKWLEYVLKAGIKNMQGDVDFDGTVTGPTNDIKVTGEGTANNGSVKVVYLGETYTFNNEKFTLTHNSIDLTGAKLFDSERNSGTITGGLRHKLFKNFSINASIESPKIIALNTTKIDNPIYYGVGKGSVTVDITGPINLLNMVITAQTAAGTLLNIPISESAINNSKGFLTFVDRNSYLNNIQNGNSKKVKVEGLQIEMNIDMTPEAQVNLIFDERVGDVIKGNGTGNIRIFSPRFDPLEIYGTFQIVKGEYLFTAKNFLAKPFVVREGGLIRWTGDPINAVINIEADYLVRTGVNTFIEEFLYTDNLRTTATARTAVNVTLILGNTLFNPTINFDLDFPELNGELKNYATTKTRLLKNNEVDFNGQIFSLIVWNSFLPNNTLSDVTNVNSISAAGINTFSEFISNQFSLFVTNIINQALSDNGLLSGVDFNLSLRNNTTLGSENATDNIFPTEIEVRVGPKFRLWNDRFDINFGGNYVRQNQYNTLINQDYVVPDFYVNYALTADRKLSLRLYGRYDFDELTLSGRRQMFGFGLRYKTEFGNMLETKSDLKDFLKSSVRTVN
jgi:hypothetical protein